MTGLHSKIGSRKVRSWFKLFSFTLHSKIDSSFFGWSNKGERGKEIDLEYFKANFGDAKLSVAECNVKEFSDQRRKQMAMSQFIDYWLELKDKRKGKGMVKGDLVTPNKFSIQILQYPFLSDIWSLLIARRWTLIVQQRLALCTPKSWQEGL